MKTFNRCVGEKAGSKRPSLFTQEKTDELAHLRQCTSVKPHVGHGAGVIPRHLGHPNLKELFMLIYKVLGHEVVEICHVCVHRYR